MKKPFMKYMKIKDLKSKMFVELILIDQIITVCFSYLYLVNDPTWKIYTFTLLTNPTFKVYKE